MAALGFLDGDGLRTRGGLLEATAFGFFAGEGLRTRGGLFGFFAGDGLRTRGGLFGFFAGGGLRTRGGLFGFFAGDGLRTRVGLFGFFAGDGLRTRDGLLDFAAFGGDEGRRGEAERPRGFGGDAARAGDGERPRAAAAGLRAGEIERVRGATGFATLAGLAGAAAARRFGGEGVRTAFFTLTSPSFFSRRVDAPMEMDILLYIVCLSTLLCFHEKCPMESYLLPYQFLRPLQTALDRISSVYIRTLHPVVCASLRSFL